MTLSVNSNSSALAALAALNRTTDDLATTNARVSSGKNISASKDNASVYAVAQSQRADIKALTAVTDGLNRAQSISDVGIAAGQSVSDLLNTLKTKVLSATDTGLDATSRAALNTDFQSLLQRITQTVKAASFDGSNLLDGSLTGGLGFIASADASATITLTGLNLSLGGSTITVPANGDISTVTNATAMLSLVTASIGNVNGAMADLGAQSDQITAHNSFVGKLSDSLTTGVGNLVDADVAAESARLTALQVQQQLGAQSLSIANQGPSILLSLFKAG
jgi:flagellin